MLRICVSLRVPNTKQEKDEAIGLVLSSALGVSNS